MHPNNTTTVTSNAEALLTPAEAAKFLKMSVSWLAKARMRGEGPPFARFGRSIRYSRDALINWMNLKQSSRRRGKSD